MRRRPRPRSREPRRARVTRCRAVWLEVTPAEAARRLAGSRARRPLLRGARVRERLEILLAERQSLYAEVASGSGPDRRPERRAGGERRARVAGDGRAVSGASRWPAGLAPRSAVRQPMLARESIAWSRSRRGSRAALPAGSSRPGSTSIRAATRFTRPCRARDAERRRGDGAQPLGPLGRRRRPSRSQARLLLAGPTRSGCAWPRPSASGLDLAAEGDTLTAYAPRERLGMRARAGRRSLGVRRPGVLGVRLWSATWHPPAGAWQKAERADSLLRLRWSEGGRLARARGRLERAPVLGYSRASLRGEGGGTLSGLDVRRRSRLAGPGRAG